MSRSWSPILFAVASPSDPLRLRFLREQGLDLNGAAGFLLLLIVLAQSLFQRSRSASRASRARISSRMRRFSRVTTGMICSYRWL
jgi:hypothetical protein